MKRHCTINMADICIHIVVYFLNDGWKVFHHFSVFILVDNCRGV